MNCIERRCVKYSLSIALIGAFLLSSEMPLLASPPREQQSSAPSSAPPASEDSLPDAPQAQNAQAQTVQPPAGQNQQGQPPQEQQPPANTPSGAAGAKAANPKGAPVAQPAGAAVAPARERGHRSLLIKLGLLAGAGVAVGSAVALSHGSPSRPPGASSSAATHP
jgi:hypothetical protein